MPVRRFADVVLLLSLLASCAFGQSVNDPALEVRTWIDGLDSPTGIAFTGNGDEALIIQKEDGRVRLMRNRRIVRTALNLPVANDSERGLLGITLHPNFDNNQLVYLYHTAAGADGGDALTHRIDRYRFENDRLTFDRNIKILPATPGPNHDGGKITFGPDGKLYAIIGDLNRNERTQNHQDSGSLSNTGVILRLNASGSSPTDNPFYDRDNRGTSDSELNDIYAYGIRNSFGIAFDPKSDNLWDTENGPGNYDEINRIRPGFNSGWEQIMGPSSRNPGVDPDQDLVSLGDEAFYANPRFSWLEPVAPTDLHFNTSTRLGRRHKNDLFVGDVNTGSLYKFDLNDARNALDLDGDLRDRVADNDGGLSEEQGDILFGDGFGVITDILTGPGGMFVLSMTNGELYRIRETPGDGISSLSVEYDSPLPLAVPEPACVSMLAIACTMGRRHRSPARSSAFN